MSENKIITIAELNIDISDSYKKTAELGRALDDLKAKKKSLKKEDVDYQEQLALTNAEIDITNKLYKNSQAITTAAVAAKKTDITTIEQLEIQNKGLQAAQKGVNLATEEGLADSKKYNETIDANTSVIKENSSATKQQAMNIGNYEESVRKALDSIGINEKSVKMSTEAYKAQVKTLVLLEEQNEKLNEQMSKLDSNSNEYKETQIQLYENDKKQTSTKLALISSTKEETTSIDKLKLDQSELLEIKKEAIARYGKESFEVNKINELLVENKNEIEKSKKSHLSLSDGMDKANGSMSVFDGTIKGTALNIAKMSDKEGGVKGLFSGMTEGINGATKATLKFMATGWGIVLGAIVLVVGIFTAAVKGNQESADKFAKAWEGSKAVLDVVWGIVVKVGSALVEFASNIMHPIDAMKKLASSVSKAVPSFDEMTAAMKTAYNQGVQLKNMEIEYEKSKSKFITTQAELNKKLAEQNIIASDGTQSPKKMEAAQMALLGTQLKIAEEKRKLAKQEMDIEQSKYDQAVKNGAGQNREAIEKLNEAKAKYIESESVKTAALGEAHNKRREMQNQNLQKDLDIMIDGYDSFKTMNEKIVNNDFETMDKRRATLDLISKKSADTYQDQINAVNKFSGTKLNADRLLNESDEKRLSSMIRESGVSYENAGRVLEFVKERRAAVGDFYDAEKTLATKSAEMKVSEMELELKKTINSYSEKLKIDETFGKKQLQQNLNAAKEEAEAKNRIAKTQLDNHLITQQDFNSKVYDNDFELKQKQSELNKTFLEQDKARLKEVESVNFANSMITQADNYNSKLELQREHNKNLEKEEILQAQKIGANTTEINKKYAKIDRDLSRQTTESKLKLAVDFASNVSKIAGENTKVGKFAAAAAATINTYQAATGAYASLASIPYVGPALGIAAAGAAIVSGLETVKKIYAVDTSGNSESTASSTSSASTSAISTPTANVNSTSAVGQGIIERSTPSVSVNQEQAQPILVLQDVEYKQRQSDKAKALSVD